MLTQARTAFLLLGGILSCLGLAAFVYWSGLSGEFMLDDGANIVHSYIRNPDWDAIVYTMTHNGSGILGRSVSMLSFVLTGLQYGLDPWGYKYHNLLLHLLNGVLLFRLLQELLPSLDQRLNENRTLLVAGITATLWLVHPLQVSTVLYAVQRMTQLSAGFILLALLAYMKARTFQTSGWQFYFYGWLLFPFCSVLAVLSKETAVLIPVYVLAIEFLVFRIGINDLRSNSRLRYFLGTFVLLPLVLGIILVIWKFDILANYNGRRFTLDERLLTQVHVIFFYLKLILLPRIREMSLFHDDYAIATSIDLATTGLLAILMLVLAAIYLLRKSAPVVAFGLTWFFVSHLLESTIFPLEMVFEHRNYLALTGLMLIPTHVILTLSVFRSFRFVIPVVIAMFAFMTATRASEWGDSRAFYTMAVKEHPGSARALNNYINFQMSTRDYVKITQLLEKQIMLTPLEAGAILHSQIVRCGTGELDETALAKARELFERYPASVYSLNSLQSLMVNVLDGKCPEVTVEEVKTLLETAMDFSNGQMHSQNLSYLQRMRGIVAFRQGYYAQGYAYFRMAHELTGDIALLAELMKSQLELGRLGDAQETFDLMKRQNAERFGIDQHQLDQAREMLESTHRSIDQAAKTSLDG